MTNMVYYINRMRVDLKDDEIDALVDDMFIGHTVHTGDRTKQTLHDYYRRWQAIHAQKEREFEEAAQAIHSARHFAINNQHVPGDVWEKMTIVDSLIEEIRIGLHRDNLCRDACMAELATIQKQEDAVTQRIKGEHGDHSNA